MVQLDKKTKKSLAKFFRQSRAAMTPEERRDADCTDELINLTAAIKQALERKGIQHRTLHQAMVTVVATR